MMKPNLKIYFQDIHYSRKKPNIFLDVLLSIAEFFYKLIINFKNFLYDKKILNENNVNAYVICVGNITTGGVGKTPITIELANKYANEKNVAIISRGYGSKLNTSTPQIIKDNKGIKFENGLLCGDEPYQIAKKTSNNVAVIICKDRLKACQKAILKYNSEVIIMDDGFSNRKVKKDKTILVFDAEMKYGNSHLLPYGPLREPICAINRCDEIYITDKGCSDIENVTEQFKTYNKKLYLCKMEPSRIYNLATGAEIIFQDKCRAIVFCAIGQPVQFFEFAKRYYDIIPVAFEDHHKYTHSDLSSLIKIADKNNTTTLLTTQKDEAKIKELTSLFNGYSFNVLELKNTIEEIN